MLIVLFDIDATLLDTRGAGKAAFQAVLAAEFGIREVARGVPFAGRTDRAIVRDLFRVHGIADTPSSWDRFLANYPVRLRETLPRHRGYVLPGVRQLVDHLHRRADSAIGLLTGNVESGARLKLTHFGLNGYFPFGGFGDRHIDRADVARDALVAARQHCGRLAAVEGVVVVGDTPHDIRCGRAIGARSVAVATGSSRIATLAAERPDLLLQDLSDTAPLLDLVDSILAG